VLSHPLVVEAAETLFVPACVHNNTENDADARVREALAERAWNNPVVRFLDGDRNDLGKVADDWTLAALLDGMVQARTAGEHDVPTWLRLVRDEERARRRGLERAVFAMT
jgi:hypothetical protein